MNLHTAKIQEFDISGLIDIFNQRLLQPNSTTEYYFIITEIAKLNRSELIEFKKRLSLSMKSAEQHNRIIPSRIYIPRTNCGFVFIPLNSSDSMHWDNVLFNLTVAHKYDVKAKKCIGVAIFKAEQEPSSFDCRWLFTEYDWKYESEIENYLMNHFPFREVKICRIDNRYK